MERTPYNADRIFEVCIYNKEVRSLVKDNQSHAFFDDHWADEKIRDLLSDNADVARHLASTRFPPDEGFVITSVKPIVLH